MDQAERFSLRDVLYVLFRHGRSIVLITLLAVLTVAGYLATTSTLYSAETKVLVGIGREKLEDVGLETRPTGNLVFQERAQNINNEVEILRDPALTTKLLPVLKARLAVVPPAGEEAPKTGLRALVARIKQAGKDAKAWVKGLQKDATDLLVSAGLVKPVDPDIALAVSFYRALSATAVKETDVISVGFTWDDPAFAADALNIYLAEYQQQHLRVYEAKQSVQFFQAQLEKAQGELHGVEAQLADFLHSGGISNFDLEKTQLLTELGTLRQDASAARLEESNVRLKLASVGRANQGGSGWVETPDPADAVAGAQALDQSFVALLDQRTKLLARFQPQAQPVRDVDAQIARLRSQKVQGLNDLYHGRLAAAADKVAALDSEIAGKEKQLHELTSQTTDFDSIQRRRTAAEALVTEYRQKLEELQVNRDLNSQQFSSVRVLSTATPPLLPTSPRRGMMLGLGAAFGLLGGIAYAVLAEFVGRTFRRPSDVARVLRLPVLASIPELR